MHDESPAPRASRRTRSNTPAFARGLPFAVRLSSRKRLTFPSAAGAITRAGHRAARQGAQSPSTRWRRWALFANRLPAQRALGRRSLDKRARNSPPASQRASALRGQTKRAAAGGAGSPLDRTEASEAPARVLIRKAPAAST